MWQHFLRVHFFAARITSVILCFRCGYTNKSLWGSLLCTDLLCSPHLMHNQTSMTQTLLQENSKCNEISLFHCVKALILAATVFHRLSGIEKHYCTINQVTFELCLPDFCSCVDRLILTADIVFSMNTTFCLCSTSGLLPETLDVTSKPTL